MRAYRASVCAIFAMAALLLAGCGPASSNDSANEIVIGVVEDDSGPGAAYSKIGVASIKAAAADINAQGGVMGKRLEIATHSDDSDPSRSPTTTRRLIGQDGAVALLFTTGSGSIIADKTVLQEEKIPGIAPTSAAAQVVTPPDADYSFIQVPSTLVQAKAFAGAFEAIGAQRVALFSDDTSTMAAYNTIFRQEFRSAGIEIVADERSPVDATDVTAQVSKIRAARPDAVLASTVGGQIEVLFHNSAQNLLKGTPRFSLASIGNQPQNWKLANPGALDGVVFTGALTDDNPRTRRARASLRRHNGPGFTMTDYDAQAYNSVHLLKAAIERAGSTDPERIHAALNRLEGQPAYFGQRDFTVSYSAGDHEGADGACGLVFTTFRDNRRAGAWSEYQPPCGPE